MPSLDQHIAARRDTDLLARVTAAAERAGINQPQAWAEANMGRIVAVDIPDGTKKTTVADVHAYACAQYKPAKRPGEDPAYITDAQVIAAVQAVHAPPTPSA